ncbi:MAG: hypothetical protein ABJE95_16625 [Byssovorax sp.]
MNRLSLTSFAAIALLSFGCGSSESPATGAGGAGGAASNAEKLSFSYTTPPGQEKHWCQYVKVPHTDSGEVFLTGHSTKWGVGIHHVQVSHTTPDLPAGVDTTKPFDCFAAGASKYVGTSLFLDQEELDSDFPAGTGYALKSDEVIVILVHTVNVTTSDAPITLGVDLKLGDASTIKNRLGLIQFYDPYIYVPAHAAASATMRCKIPSDMTVFQTTTHFHTRGLDAAAFVDAADGTPGKTPIVESTSWEHPSAVAAPLDLKAGSYVRTTCKYKGDAADTIQGADKLDNEMCMFIAYYYPTVAPDQQVLFENCAQGDEYGSGTATCGDTLSCIQKCPPTDAPHYHDGQIDVGSCFQKCIVGSCPSATTPFQAMNGCIQQNCAAECGMGGPDCPTCIGTKCGKETGACTSHTCP